MILAPAVANAPQNHLVRANGHVGAQQQTNLANSMPVWGPTNDAQLAWIAFTSTRDYGLVLTAGSKIGSDQIPPFPGVNVRDLTENNHRPFWTVDTIPQVNEPPPK